MQRHRLVAFAAKHNRPLQAELEIACRLERDRLRVRVIVVWIGMALQTAVKEVVSHRPNQPRKVLDMQWLNPIDAKRIDVFRIVGPRHRTAQSRPKPRVRFAAGDLVPQDVIRQRRLHDPERVLRRNRPGRDRRLRVIGWCKVDLVDGRKLRRQRLRVSGTSRRVLILCSHIQRERSTLIQRGEASNVVETRAVRPAVVVEERLPQVKAVLQDRAGHSHHPRIDRLQSVHRAALRPANRAAGHALVGQLVQQRGQNVLRLLIVAGKNLILGPLQHVQCTPPRVGTQRQGHRVQVAHGIQPHHRRIHPAIHWNVRAAVRIARLAHMLRLWRAVRWHGCVRRLRSRRRGCYHRRGSVLWCGYCGGRLRGSLAAVAGRRSYRILALGSRGWSTLRFSRAGRLGNCVWRTQTQAQGRNAGNQQRDPCPHSHLETLAHQSLQCNRERSRCRASSWRRPIGS